MPLLRQSAPRVYADADGPRRTESSRTPEVGLDVHVTDVVNVLKHEDLRDVVRLGTVLPGR